MFFLAKGKDVNELPREVSKARDDFEAKWK
jgi:hypothetical protein